MNETASTLEATSINGTARPALRAEPAICPGGANIKPPFEMGVCDLQAGTTKYEYDAEDHRIAVIKNAGADNETRTEFVVDCAGELSQILQSTTYEGKTDEQLQGQTKAQPQQAEVVEKLVYVYGNGLLAQHSVAENSDLYYHYNNVGSTTVVTDADGNVKYSYEYTPFGDLIKGSYGQILFLYNGQYGVMSDDNGLYYMRARYYNISIKRFINQDVLIGTIKDSQSLNRYAYVEGNPVTYLDPFGMERELGDVRSYGLSVNGGFVFVGGLGIQMTSDSNGGVALQGTVSLGVGTPGIGLTIDVVGAKGYSCDDATGVGGDVGFGAGLMGLVAGASAVVGSNYQGWSSSAGVGTPGLEAHAKLSYAWNIWKNSPQ